MEPIPFVQNNTTEVTEIEMIALNKRMAVIIAAPINEFLFLLSGLHRRLPQRRRGLTL